MGGGSFTLDGRQAYTEMCATARVSSAAIACTTTRSAWTRQMHQDSRFERTTRPDGGAQKTAEWRDDADHEAKDWERVVLESRRRATRRLTTRP